MTLSALIERERARLIVALVGAGVAGGLAGAVVVAAAGGWLLGDARWLTLPRALPWLVWGVILGAAAAAALWTRARLRRDGAPTAVARAVEGERALRAGTVRGALEVGQQGALGAMAAADVAQRLGAGAGPLAPALQRQARGRFAGAAAACVAAVAALVAVAVGAGDGLAALAHPWDAASGALLPAIRWADAPAALVRGQPLALRVVAPGRRTLQVSVRETGRPWRQLTVPVRDDGAAALALGATDADVALVATDGRASSDTLRVRVTDRAYLGDVTVQAEYPGYLARAAETLAAGEPLRVPRGTALVLRGRASVALQRVALTGGAGPSASVPLPARGHVFEGRFVPTVSGRWTWRADGEAGAVAEVPAPLDVQLLSDSAPMVVLASPAQDSTIDGVAGLRARVLASDDHGLASVALRTWVERAGGGREAAVSTALAGAGPAWTGEAAIEPAAMSLKPGDKLHVQAVAVDASPWRQAGASREVVLKVPSSSELRALARASADSAVAGASALADAQRELQRRTGDAARARAQGSTAQGNGAQQGADKQSQMSFQAAERAKGLAQEQRQLANRVEQLQQQAKGLERQLSQAGALDSALSRQMRDVQQMLRDAMTPEMAKQLQSLERSAGQLSQSEARQSLEQLAAQQRAMREQLEKSAEMLKRAALEGAMQTLRDEAKELATEQQREAERLDRGQQSGDAGKQRELAQRSRELGKDIDQLGDRLQREKASVGAERVAQAEQHADRSAEAMQRAAAAAQRGADPAERRNTPERRDGSQAQEQAQQGGEPRPGEQRSGEQRAGEQRAGEQRSGEQPSRGAQQGQEGQRQQGQQQQGADPQGAPRGGQPQGARQQGGQPQQGGQQQGGQQQGGQQQGGQQQGGQKQQGDQAGAAREAANEMQAAAERLSAARQDQIDSWKGELSSQLDQAIQETMQMAREQGSLEREARAGKSANDMRGQQSAIQQGVDQAAQRLDEAGKSSSLLSQRAQRAMADAKQQVSQATQAVVQRGGQQPGGSQGAGQQGQGNAADAMKEAGESLQRAAAALVRDRERVNAAASASGFEDMVEQLKQLAGQQGQINQQAGSMPVPMPGAGGQGARDAMRDLARQQKGVAEKLDELGDADPSGRADALAREARQLAQSMDRVGADPSTLQRQQQLYKRLLEAGKTLERDERDDTGKREAKSGTGVAGVAPADGAASGRGATKFPMPTWNELRALSPEERRVVLEYFRRLNGTP